MSVPYNQPSYILRNPMFPNQIQFAYPLQRPESSCSLNSNSSLGSIQTPVNPPIHNKNYQESRYKTELCRHFQETGDCPHSQQCLFAHGLAELVPFRGRHQKYKTKLCKDFHGDGFCSFGPRCSYIHSTDSVGLNKENIADLGQRKFLNNF